ncbi:uncharacterized protein PRCAT00002298001 [Priceomyces carsonii]|uniref:uncharacterized protein n=1 Tax=Priceomyces carsonii TaxID=28549 RepID=UPI002EDA9E27|nr:unnamed protein product [Priceomyces carsonii]
MSTALNSYRTALRAAKLAFHGDVPVLSAAKIKIREGFEQNRKLEDEAEIKDAIDKMNEVSKFLVQNIVQGEQQQDGKYFLNFHEKTELGDNESVKESHRAKMGSLAGTKVKKCSDVRK